MGLKQHIGRYLREIAAYPAIVSMRLAGGGAPKVLFFTSTGPVAAGLLRVYEVAERLRAVGWQALVVPAQLDSAQRARLIAVARPDLLFFQKCRHLANDAAHAGGRPYIFDLDDADFFNHDLHEQMVRTAAGAVGVIAGSQFIAQWCRQHNPNTRVIWTGSPVSAGPRPDHADRRSIVTWAQSEPLAYPQEFEFIVGYLRRLVPLCPGMIFRLYGIKDPSVVHAQLDGILPPAQIDCVPPLGYQEFLSSLRDTALGLSPVITASDFSKGKSFGKILAYLDAKVPVICSDEVDHALFFTPALGVVSNDLDVWVNESARLLGDPSARQAMSEQAFEAFEQRLSIDAATRRVQMFISETIGQDTGGMGT